MSLQPHQYPRRVLLCVIGSSPQIITETLYALAVETDGRPPFVPTEIRVLTTAHGAEQARLSLLAEDRAMLRRLREDHGLPAIRFDPDCIEVFARPDGTLLADIVTPEDNQHAADHITRCVRELTEDAEAAIHASIAGGRKTMGFYLGYAMSLFGREQDRVSHVLVSEGFTEHRDFFYKPKKPVTLKNDRTGWEMSTADAHIHLAEIPLVRLRSLEFAEFSGRRLGFTEAVERANRLASGIRLQVRVDRSLGEQAGKPEVTLGERPLKLSASAAHLLHWLAVRRLHGEADGSEGWVEREPFKRRAGDARNVDYLRQLLALARLYGEHSDLHEQFKKLLEDAGYRQEPMRKQLKSLDKWLEPLISNINKEIARVYGQTGVERMGIAKRGQRGAYGYRLALAPAQIEIEE